MGREADVVPGWPSSSFLLLGKKQRWRQRRDHRQAHATDSLGVSTQSAGQGSAWGSKSESRCYLVISGIERKAAHQPRVSWQGPKQTCPGTPLPCPGHGLWSCCYLSPSWGKDAANSQCLTSLSLLVVQPTFQMMLDPSGSFITITSTPQAALLLRRDSTSHSSFTSPVLPGSSFSQGALHLVS